MSEDAFARLHDDASMVLSDWEPSDAVGEGLRQEYLEFLAAHSDAMSRACLGGHLTASAIVLDENLERVLLTLHPKAGRWLQLGGHCEAVDATLRAAALREVREESGIDDVVISESPIHLDRHPIMCTGGPSEHLDVQYLALVPAGAQEVMSDESDDLRWFPVNDLPPGLDASVLAMIDIAVHSRDGSR